MNKSILFLAVALSFGSCKSDQKSGQNDQDMQPDVTYAEQQSDTDPSIKDSIKAIDSTDLAKTNIEAEPVEEKPKKKVKKKSFNPPHIAVLEQSYEEEVEEPKKVVKPKKEVKPKKVDKSKQSVKAKETTVQKKKDVFVAKPVAPKPTPVKNKLTEIVFRRNFFSFGDIMQGDTVRFNFDFTNIGEVPLVIKDAKGSCSCTHPEFPLQPIAPGESGKISGIYVSDDKKGPQNASVTITTNTEPATHQLLLDGTVSISGEDKGGAPE